MPRVGLHHLSRLPFLQRWDDMPIRAFRLRQRSQFGQSLPTQPFLPVFPISNTKPNHLIVTVFSRERVPFSIPYA